jgi:hypothetical protein
MAGRPPDPPLLAAVNGGEADGNRLMGGGEGDGVGAGADLPSAPMVEPEPDVGGGATIDNLGGGTVTVPVDGLGTARKCACSSVSARASE